MLNAAVTDLNFIETLGKTWQKAIKREIKAIKNHSQELTFQIELLKT